MKADPPSFNEGRNRRQRVRAAGLDPNYWYVVEQSKKLRAGQTIAVQFFGQPGVVIYRSTDGTQLYALEDRCVHRQLKLSLGQVSDCRLVCSYHGWQYEGASGEVVDFSHELFGRPVPPRLRVRTFPVAERYGLIWLFPSGDEKLATERQIPHIPELEAENPKRWACAPIDFTWKAHHSMIIDNVNDFTHAYLHRKYRPFTDAKLRRCEAIGDRVFVAYDTQVGAGRISGLFVDRQRVNTNHIELCYDYPHQWSNVDGRIKHWCFLLPIDRRLTRVFFLFYFETLRVPFTSIPIPRILMSAVMKLANVMFIRSLLQEDGWAVEAEQEGYETNFDAPPVELNPAIHVFHDLTIRKWQEHLTRESEVTEPMQDFAANEADNLVATTSRQGSNRSGVHA
ncbi:MAG: Rieske 2Fe-2S domain-containing protein [Chthoniobacterales bacterium]